MKINSHNEWDPIREVIVGTTECLTVGLEFPSGQVTEELFDKVVRTAKKALPNWYVNDVAEDLEGLCMIFKEVGAKILRPKPYGAEKLYSTPDWASSGKDLYNVRDLHTIIGDNVIASPSPARCRYFEANGLSDIWYQYFDAGFRWISAPKPRLRGKFLTPFHDDGNELYSHEDALYYKLSGGQTETFYRLNEDEILFDAANVVRVGRDVLYLISSTGNRKGATWLQSVLGPEYRVHTTMTYRSSHLDSTILPLRPGLVLMNAARVSPKACPVIFKNWEKIYFDDMVPIPEEEVSFQRDVRNKVYSELLEMGVETDLNHMSSPWAGLNVLSLDPRTVLVHDKQDNLIRELEKHDLTVVPVRMRHCYTMLGGLHCSTLDTVRDSKLESYSD